MAVNELLGFLPPIFWPFNEKGKGVWILPVRHVGNILYCAHFLVTNTVFGREGSTLQPAFCTIDYCKIVLQAVYDYMVSLLTGEEGRDVFYSMQKKLVLAIKESSFNLKCIAMCCRTLLEVIWQCK